jgi:hypothetical protein
MSERVVNRMWEKLEAIGLSNAGVELGWRLYNADLESKKTIDHYSEETDLYPQSIELIIVDEKIEEGLEVPPAAMENVVPLRSRTP